jgi:hypothetical protein
MRPQRDLEPSRKYTRALLHILRGSDRCDEFGVPAIVQGVYQTEPDCRTAYQNGRQDHKANNLS